MCRASPLSTLQSPLSLLTSHFSHLYSPLSHFSLSHHRSLLPIHHHPKTFLANARDEIVEALEDPVGCGLWVVLAWVCGLCRGFVIFLSTLTDLPWVCNWWRGFVFCGCAGLWWVAYCRQWWWWWAFCCWWQWWVVGMGLMIHGFSGSALLRWQWSDLVLFLVAGCLIWWVFIWILWAPPPASWPTKQRGDEGGRRERERKKKRKYFFNERR